MTCVEHSYSAEVSIILHGITYAFLLLLYYHLKSEERPWTNYYCAQIFMLFDLIRTRQADIRKPEPSLTNKRPV